MRAMEHAEVAEDVFQLRADGADRRPVDFAQRACPGQVSEAASELVATP
jgi:hypothetical protein